MTDLTAQLRHNLEGVRQRMSRAAERAGRDATDVTLVAVTKTMPAVVIEALIDLGERDFGENRTQTALPKIEAIQASTQGASPSPPVTWHMIGHLQRNKVARTIGTFTMFHGVDSDRLAGAIDQAAGRASCSVDGLLQVNTSGEASKGGFSPSAVLESYEQCRKLSHLRVRGFMTMAPFVDDPESVRPVFRALREIRDEVQSRFPGDGALGLSMGMTRDFEVAIEEGADWIRVGTALFEGVSGELVSGESASGKSEG